MTDEAAQAGQPSLVNMMDVLDGRLEAPGTPGSSVIKDEMIRLAPPIWSMARPHQFTSTISGTQPLRTTDTDQAMSPSEQSHDPFIVSTTPTYSARGQLDRSKVSFPTSRGLSESGYEEDDDERRQSSVSLNEAGGRGSLSGSIGSPKQRVVEVKEEKKQTDRDITASKQEKAVQMTREDSANSAESGTVTVVPGSCSELEQSRSQATQYDQSSLPRLLKPRLKINFAWDDMTIPSSITIVSTKGEEKHIEEKKPAGVPVEAISKPEMTSIGGIPARARTSSLSWATGLAMDTASGVAKYGLSYVQGPIRRRALRDRQWASETG